jgi:putative transposase
MDDMPDSSQYFGLGWRKIATWAVEKSLSEGVQLVWGDSRDAGQLVEWAKEHLGWGIQSVRRLGTARDEKLIEPKPKTKDLKRGFTLLPRRWVVERSIAWITRWRRLARDHEGLPETSQAFIKLSASRRMLSHLAPALA